MRLTKSLCCVLRLSTLSTSKVHKMLSLFLKATSISPRKSSRNRQAIFVKSFVFVFLLWAFVILFPESNKITPIAGQQHVTNRLHSREKRIFLFLYFPYIFCGVPSFFLFYSTTMKTASPYFEEICKSYYLLPKDRQGTGWRIVWRKIIWRNSASLIPLISVSFGFS